eukprot:6427830-Prymnesium_polylepis.1
MIATMIPVWNLLDSVNVKHQARHGECALPVWREYADAPPAPPLVTESSLDRTPGSSIGSSSVPVGALAEPWRERTSGAVPSAVFFDAESASSSSFFWNVSYLGGRGQE